jgi:hypothetical protein
MTNAVNLASAAGTGFAFRNRIINGAMEIDQRNAGASVTINTTSDAYSVDRFLGAGQAADGVFTLQQSTTAPAGFKNSLVATVTTADASIGAAQYYLIAQKIEGFNCSDLAFGAASAKTVTLSFWVRSSVTGTFSGALANGAYNRSYPFTYTISSANTFEYKTVTIAGDTTGTWLTDNGIGLRIYWNLGSGVDNTGTAGAWVGAGNIGADSTVALISTLNATFYLTGVQLEVGSVATPFERRLYGQEVALCQRYFCKSSSLNVVPVNGAAYTTAGMFFSSVAGAYYTTAAYTPFMKFPVTMRTEPATITIYNTNLPSPSTAGQWSIFSPSGGVWYNCSVSAQSVTQEGWAAALAGSWGSTGALPLYGAWAASAEL